MAHDCDRHLNRERGGIRPGRSDRGQRVMPHHRTNARRISKDGKRFFAPRIASMRPLRFGSLAPGHRDHDSRADFFVAGTMIGLRIPWGPVNFADPSSMQIVWIENGRRSRPTDGIGLIALSYKPSQRGLTAATTGGMHNCADVLPAEGSPARFAWEGWTTPLSPLVLKESYHRYRKALAEIPEGP